MGKDQYTGSQEDEYDAGGDLVGYEEEQPEVDTKSSAVASKPGSRIAMMLIVAAVAMGGLYFAFFGGEAKRPEEEALEKKPTGEALNKAQPVTPEVADTGVVASVPDLPAPPPIQVPEPPPPPQLEQAVPMVAAPPPSIEIPQAPAPAPIIEAPVPTVSKEDAEAERQRMLARRNSAIMLFGGGGGGGSAGASGKEGDEGEDGKEKKDGDKSLAEKLLGDKADGGELGSAEFSLKKTAAEQAKATLIGRDLGSIVAQGKIIDAVLETAINTDLPGQLRAIVSRDVYAEQGKNILLPKGSRLIGTYQSDIKRGQLRVEVIWNRAIRPDGIDIMIDSPGTDQLGRSGVEGIVDNKYFELFSSAILVSSITAGVAVLADNASGSEGVTTTTNTDGSTTSSGSAADFAIADGVRNIGDVSKGLLDDLIQVKPTITVDQGTRIKVFVNRDLIFPASVANRVRFVK